MAKSKTQKAESLKTISEVLQKATSVVFACFDKFTVADVTAARKSMRSAGVKLLAVKKTLLAKALGETSLGEMPLLPGQIVIAYGQDALAPAREVFSIGKRLEGKLSILGGIFENAFAGKEKMTAIASIPPREVLLGQFVNLINSPIQRFVIALDAIAQKG